MASPVSKDLPLKDDELAIKDQETIAPSTRPSKAEGGASSNVVPALMKMDSSAVLNIIKLLRMIALDGFKTCTIQGKSGTTVITVLITVICLSLSFFHSLQVILMIVQC